MYEDLKNKATQIDSERQAATAKIRNDQFLTVTGKADAIAKVESTYRAAIDGLQRTWELRLIGDKAENTVRLERERTAAVDAKRKVLGDHVLAMLYQRRIEGMDSADIQAAFEAAAPGFERMLIGEIGRTVIGERLRQPGHAGADIMAANILADVNPDLARLESTAKELAREGESGLAALDVESERQRLSNGYGVNAAYLDMRHAA